VESGHSHWHGGCVINASEIVIELQRRYVAENDGLVSDADISRWTQSATDTVLYDALAAELAKGYHHRRFSFGFCDTVVNALYGCMIAKQLDHPAPSWPKLFWRVYEAFDAGEWHRSPDKSDDPIAEFTDPEIAEVVRDL
jgi:hypothetical protein